MSDSTPEIAKSDDSPTDPERTVKFDVGGRLYKVSRSLIEKFPSTMLARMISDTWQTDPEVTLFIDRDSERFRFCLDYMRDGQVWLPLNVPLEALLHDLAFYGFEDVDPTKIYGGSSNQAAARHLLKCKEEHAKVLLTYRENAQAAETTTKCEEVAYACFLRLSQDKSLEVSFPSNTELELYNSACVAVDNQAEFQDHLAKYGLAFVKTGCNGNGYTLTLKEKKDTIN
jgi:ubiquitin